ncbi:retrotransposon protein, putative, ty1-copia subclass [Tanacetum coccineum]
MVPTKKVDKTPYELWYGKVPNLSYLKVWGCEALVKRDMPNKLQQRSFKYIFIGYPKERWVTISNFPPENKIVVARYVEFLEKNLIYQEVSRRDVELEKKIQDEDTSPFEITSKIPMEVEGLKPPQEELIPVHRSVWTYRAPERLCLNVEEEEHSLGDLNEPSNYKAAMLDPESNKWLDAMNAEMQSMKDNQVWCLVDLPPNCKTIGSKITSRFQQNPRKPHWTAVKTILKYLRNTKEMFLVYGRNPEAELRVDCYCNAGFETDRDEIKYLTGYVFVLNGSALD